MLLCWYVAIYCIVLSLEDDTQLTPETSITIDENAELILFGMRHGNRHPKKFLNKNSRIWGFEGVHELTQFGKREGFGFGKELREFVGPLVGNNYMQHEVTLYTSSANSCQMTLQVVMAGFYPPDTFAEWNHALEWSPVPYTINDLMLETHSTLNCSATQRAWEPIIHDNLPELMDLTTTNAQLFDYIAKHTGWNRSIESASNLADNILEMNLYNASLPDWIERPTSEEFNKRSLKETIMMFLEKHSLTCVNYEPCRDITGGIWLNHILTILHNTAYGEQTQKLIGYVSHLELVLSVMKLLRINQTYLDTTAGFLMEYRNKPNKSIRLLYHEASAIDKHIIRQAEYLEELEELSDPNHWIPFESFYQLIKDKAIANWEEICGKVTQCVAPEDDSKMSSQGTVSDSDHGGSLSDHNTASLAPSAASLCNIVLHLLIILFLIL
ncbi:histidine acid phosphatase [Onchocerca flexuosa]|uniref:Histidine acid phosphatase n=1 Tax=Onchocerca flexuosa TaxID=387005 RepID=A0A238BY07_9BILA|nr:histidine acid phosphatase [Onchocerca flexuosa]